MRVTKIKKSSGRSISRILSMAPRRHWAVISLGDVSPHRSVQPTRDWPFPQEGKAHAKTSRLPSSTDNFVPAWPCSRRGLPGRTHYCARRWSLTPPFHHHHTHLSPKGGGGGCFFLWPVSGRFAPFSGSPPRLLSDAVLSADFPSI